MLSLVRNVLNPYDTTRRDALARRWRDMPGALKTETQVIGRYVWGCGATHGIHERCNFGCTACYLGKTANHQPPLPFAAVARQMDVLAENLGAGGNIQITSGEVTLLPAEELVRILLYAREKKLVPMVMSHGDVLLHQPDYLDRLITEGRLTKISIHVDITQRGRKNYSRVDEEKALNPLRDQMAELLRGARQRTGRKLKAATTMTVNRQNIGQLGDVVHWFLDNADTFRILSFQPQAETGRTDTGDGVDGAAVWTALEAALGMKLTRHPAMFGHPDCTWFNLILMFDFGDKRALLPAVRLNKAQDQRLMVRLLEALGGVNLNDQKAGVSVGRVLGILLRSPVLLMRTLAYAVRRSWDERRWIPATIWAALRLKLRLRPTAFVVHNFMDRETLDTEVGRERVAACAFKLPVNGRMVSMCEMNGTELREQTYVV
ncbi:radical SAM protein [Acanthopleuribacter pedis]|uniref:Radical SAM protein n=1 Tax=Acanthopleuribacter pedis TaxID=442870 RepID=A0A8J7Q6S9_9BACT|nr:radical SAM protein [Acanthopleuribacter pedis]MBO1318987.1 radical SAM protein [Acanthopleuribacter pedis]